MKKLFIQFTFGAISGIFILSSFTAQAENQNRKQPADYSEPSSLVSSTPPTTKSIPLVNYAYFEQLVTQVKQVRNSRLVSLNHFLSEGNKSNKVILDTRLKAMYDLKHVKGAIHLNFSDFTTANLTAFLLCTLASKLIFTFIATIIFMILKGLKSIFKIKHL